MIRKWHGVKKGELRRQSAVITDVLTQGFTHTHTHMLTCLTAVWENYDFKGLDEIKK